MRIVFVTNNYTPYSGGVVSSIIATIDGLHKKGHEVFIITLDFLADKHDDPEYVFRVKCPIKFKYKKNYMAVPWRAKKQVHEIIKKINPDIIHTHHPFLLGVAALSAAQKLSIPIIFTYHTLYKNYLHYVPLPKFITQPSTNILVNKFCTKVDGIIAPSNQIKDFLLSQKINTPIVVIPSPIRNSFLETRLKHEKVTSEKCELLYVGRFAAEKNIPFLFDVIKRLPENYKLILVGYGPEYEKIKSYAYDTLCLPSDRVHFIYKPEHDTLIQLYAQADLFLFPSQTDTQGLVLIEAMSQSTPVIALDGPGQRDIIKNGHNGYIVENVTSMASKIEEIGQNSTLRQKLAQNAFKMAQKYASDNLIDNLVSFYNRVK